MLSTLKLHWLSLNDRNDRLELNDISRGPKGLKGHLKNKWNVYQQISFLFANFVDIDLIILYTKFGRQLALLDFDQRKFVAAAPQKVLKGSLCRFLLVVLLCILHFQKDQNPRWPPGRHLGFLQKEVCYR